MERDVAQRDTQAQAGRPTTALGQAARQMRQFMCGLHGHDMLLHFDNRRVSLQCVACGYESPGWTVPGAPAGHDAGRSDRAAGVHLTRHRIA